MTFLAISQAQFWTAHHSPSSKCFLTLSSAFVTCPTSHVGSSSLDIICTFGLVHIYCTSLSPSQFTSHLSVAPSMLRGRIFQSSAHSGKQKFNLYALCIYGFIVTAGIACLMNNVSNEESTSSLVQRSLDEARTVNREVR